MDTWAVLNGLSGWSEARKKHNWQLQKKNMGKRRAHKACDFVSHVNAHQRALIPVEIPDN